MAAVTLVVMHEAEVVEQAANELYGLPPADFTSARDQLARRLRRDGLREEADAVRGLHKPNVAAWALNQLARRRPRDVERLIATGKRLRTAQEALLGGGDPSALKRATAEERELVDKLTRDAAAVASEAAATTGGSLDERIRDTLHAVALDEQTAADFAAGRLVREQRAVGLFGADSVGTAPAAKRSSGDRPAASRKRGRDDTESRKVAERRQKAEAELAAAKTEERKAQREHAGAAKAAERAQKQAKDAEERAGETRKRAEEARTSLRRAKRRESDTAKAYDRAARAVAVAEKKLG